MWFLFFCESAFFSNSWLYLNSKIWMYKLRSPKSVLGKIFFPAKSSLINFWKILRCHSQVDKDQSRPLSAFANDITFYSSIHKIILKSDFYEIRDRTWVQVDSRQNKQASDWLTYLIYQLEACFSLAGSHLTSCSGYDLRKNWL